MKSRHAMTPAITSSLFLAVAFLAHLTPTVGAQDQVTLETIGATKIRDNEIEVTPLEDFSGSLRFGTGQQTELVVQVAVQREKYTGWWIQAPTAHVRPSTREVRWRLEGVAIGSPTALWDCRAAFAILARAAAKPLATGLIDEATLRSSATTSQTVRARRKPCEPPPPPDPRPRIRIDYIREKPVRVNEATEVRLQEALQGEVILPSGKVVRIIVQPLNSTGRWVMEHDPQVSGRRWHATALFGREGLDEWVDFLVYAIVSDPSLPMGREILPDEWHSLNQQKIVVVVSPVVLVRRVELPPTQGITIRIHAIESTIVDGEGRWSVDRKSGITGTITGRSLSVNEDVWILSTPSFNDTEWELLGKASLQDNRYWQMPPKVLGDVGEFRDLIAVMSRDRIESLSDEEIRQNMPFSTRVHVVIKDRPPLEVFFSAIDRQPLGSRNELQISSLSSLEGTVTGRPIEEGETIRIFKTSADDSGEWEFLAAAPMVNLQSWAVPPIRLGRIGDKLVLLAVVADDEIKELNPGVYPQVLAFSAKIYVELK